MPITRYQIRNEYGLADPELYRAADRDDPEALLEGVAMAGLVGVLRQLGDLADFAAEIFHDLHEEVMVTSARGHGLMLRVQQLEAEFPSIEKAFLSQTSHSGFNYNAGVDWHANLQMDQNLITRGDMPRFILDSYEECRGPPRLFMLDKFDVAGAGACLKRYSDPSSFKMVFTSSNTMEEEIQREKKVRKIKKKGSRWRNGETLESFLAPKVNSELQHMTSDRVSENIPTKRVKLKSRHLNDSDTSSKRSYMERLLEVHPSEQNVTFENSVSHSPIKMKSIDSSESTPEVHEVVIDTSATSPLIRETHLTQAPNKQEVTEAPIDKWEKQTVKGDELSGKMTEPVGVENNNSTFDAVEQKGTLAYSKRRRRGSAGGFRLCEAEKIPPALQNGVQKELLVDSECKTEGSADGYRSDDIASELDNYMDALTTMESEVETDSESKAKPELGLLKIASQGMDSDTNKEQQELRAHSEEPDSVENSTASLGLSKLLDRGRSSCSNSDNLADTQPPQWNMISCDVPASSGICRDETPDRTSEEVQINGQLVEVKSLEHLLSSGTCNAEASNIPNLRSEFGEASCSSCVTDSTSTVMHLYPQESPDEVQSTIAEPREISSGCVTSTKEADKHMDGDWLCTSETYELPSLPKRTVVLHGFGENSDIISDDSLLHSSDQAVLPLGLRNDVLEKTLSAEYAEEFISEDVADRLDAPGHLSQTHNESILENVPTGCVEDSPLSVIVGETQESMNQDTEACSGGGISPTIPAFSPNSSSIGVWSNGLATEMENVIAPDENLKYSRASVGLHSNDDFVGRKLPSSEMVGESLEYSRSSMDLLSDDDFVECDLSTSNMLPVELEQISDAEEPQESHNVDSAELLPLCSETENLPADKELPSNLLEWEVRDWPMSVGEFLYLPGGTTISNPPTHAPQIERLALSDDLLNENVTVKADSDNHYPGSDNSPQESDLSVQLQEECVPGDAVPNQQELEIMGISSPNDLPGFDAESKPDVPLSPQEEDQKMATPRDSNSELYIIDSSDLSDVKLLDDVSHVMPCESAQIDLHPFAKEVPIYPLESEQDFDTKSSLLNHPHESAKENITSITNFLTEPAIPVEEVYELQAGTESITSQQEEHLKLSDVQFEKSQYAEKTNMPSDSMELGIQPSEPEPEPDSNDIVSNGEINGLDLPLSNTSICQDLESEESVPSQSSFEHSLSSLGSSATALSTFLSLGLRTSEAIHEQLSESQPDEPIFSFIIPDYNASREPIEEAPPLPPLPPLEWRMGKLRLGSLNLDGETVQPPSGPNPFMSLSTVDKKPPHGLLQVGDENVQRANRFAPLPTLENEVSESCSQTFEGEMVRPPELSSLPPITEDERYQHSTVNLVENRVHPSNSSLQVSPIEDMKLQYGQEALGGGILQQSNPFAPLPSLECDSSQHCSLLLEGGKMQPLKPSGLVPCLQDERSQFCQLLPGLEEEKSQHHLSLERDMVLPPNPFMVVSAIDDEKHQYGYRAFGGENMQTLNFSVPLPTTGVLMPQPGSVSLVEECLPTPDDVTVPTIDDQKPNGKIHSLLLRPRDPLIEAVASHDKSTLRKVSELVRPSAQPSSDERDTLLEQIRAKSFNLKPAVVAKPNIKGPSTNLKVAAILEKANAIRQAFVGSDEDDDEDSWSDS